MFTFIKEQASKYGLIHIHAEVNLNQIKQTAFSWTSTPGSACLAMNKKYYLQAYNNPNVVCIIAPPSAITSKKPEVCTIIVDKADEFFYLLHNMALHQSAGLPEKMITGNISNRAVIAKTSIINDHVQIGDHVIIENDCIILDNTVICDGVVIGPKCLIGVDGFFSKQINGRKEHVRHFGGVRIGPRCKLHSDITISRSANYNEFTEIGPEVHIGHKSVVGHDCKIGMGTDISVNALLSGRVTIGNNCWIGASSSVSNACFVGDNSKIRIGSVVVSDVADNTEVSGNFAIPHNKSLKRYLKEK
jgi:acyl-[acyl carrier protein]--UDP-N-acetylglucosamine O-acyltransferase